MTVTTQPVISELTARVMRAVGIIPECVENKLWARFIVQDEHGLWWACDNAPVVDELDRGEPPWGKVDAWMKRDDSDSVMFSFVGKGRTNKSWKEKLFIVPCGTLTGV